MSKVIEKVIHDETSTFLNLKNLLYTYQFGFQKKHFIDFCLSYLNDKIFKGFDLQMAFDTIDHSVLLPKLYAIGFLKHTVNRFQSYLSNRSFLVNLGNNFFQPASVSCSVPQDSILGPLLFLIYVNDMLQVVKWDLFLYADDSCLVFQHKDINKTESQLNEDLLNICDWFVDNKVRIHFGEEKAKSILKTSVCIFADS